jgi:hypothetical protein
MKKLFTERHGMVAPRVKEELDPPVATGLLSLINARIDENWFGDAFPDGEYFDDSTALAARNF